jgi:hypothetical protein
MNIEYTNNDPSPVKTDQRWNYVWYDDCRDKNGKGRIWVCYGGENWPSHCDWIIPGTFDIYN